jgi:hypothetical protein
LRRRAYSPAEKNDRNGEHNQEDSTPSNHMTPQRKISSALHQAIPPLLFFSF